MILGVGVAELVTRSSAAPSAPSEVHARRGLNLLRKSQSFYASKGKRLFDLMAALVLLVIFLPLFIAVALGVRWFLGPNVFFRQQRVGLNGKAFEIIKFRTMLPEQRRRAVPVAEERRFSGHKTLSDPRHTKFGLMLRKFGLDEIPQLFNVLKGDMSFVGPRPELLSVAERRGYVQHARHTVRPGITGPYQLSKLRQEGDLTKGFDMDLAYLGSVSFFKDIIWILKTPLVMITSKQRSQ